MTFMNVQAAIKSSTCMVSYAKNAARHALQSAIVTKTLAQNPYVMIVANEATHCLVRLEAIIAASWLPQTDGISVLAIAKKQPIDS